MKSTKSTTAGRAQVDAFMNTLDHPLKAEVQQIREIIKNADRRMAYFADRQDLESKQIILETALKDLIKLQMS